MAISVDEAGRRGGRVVLEKYGRGFFVRIGKKGQKVMRERYPNMAPQWGKKGGRPRKLSLEEIMRDAKK
jgi:hypothetical protein